MNSAFRILFSLHRGTAQHSEWFLACVEGAWAQLVGDCLSRVCRPLSYRGNVLVVEAVDAPWLEALEGCKGEILEKLRAATGDPVLSLSFAVKP
jgi:hypothetical protein